MSPHKWINVSIKETFALTHSIIVLCNVTQTFYPGKRN